MKQVTGTEVNPESWTQLKGSLQCQSLSHIFFLAELFGRFKRFIYLCNK